MQRNRSTGLRMFLPLGVLLALAAAWSLWWYVVFTTARTQYSRAEERLAAEGVSLACAEQSWGGYPFRVEMTCAGPRAAFERNGNAMAISAMRLAALIQAYDPTHGLILLAGPTTIAPGAGREPITVAHGLARASLRLVDGDRFQASMEFPDISAQGIGAAKSIMLHLRADRTGPADIAGQAVGLVLDLPDAGALRLERAEFDASVPIAVLAARDPLRHAIQSGSILDIRRIDLKQDGLTASASGAVSLDGTGRLDGTLSTSVSDLDLLIDRVGAQLALKPADVLAARSLFGLLKAAGSRIDIVARQGKLYWGPVKIAELPSLVP